MATRVGISHTSGAVLLSARFTISLLVMLALMAAGIGRIDLKGKPLGRFIMMGMCEPVIYFIAETEGIRRTTSSFSGLMISIIPVITVLLSVIFLKERMSAKRFAWIICSVAGVALISVTQTSEHYTCCICSGRNSDPPRAVQPYMPAGHRPDPHRSVHGQQDRMILPNQQEASYSASEYTLL